MQTTRLTSADFDKMIIESVDEVMGFSRKTSELLFQFDQIKSGELKSENDTVYAEGRQGVQLAAFDRNKTAGFSCENGYVVASAIAKQLGTDVVTATAQDKLTIQNVDKFTVVMDGATLKIKGGASSTAATTGTLSATPVTGSFPFLYRIGSDNSVIGKYVLDDTAASATEFIFTGTTLTPPTDSTLEEGDVLMAIYDSEVSVGKKLVNSGDKFTAAVKLVINLVAQDPCTSEKYLMQVIMPNAKISGAFTLSAGDNPAVHNFEASALLDVCSAEKELFSIVMA